MGLVLMRPQAMNIAGQTPAPNLCRRCRAGESGFSLIEGLIGAGILLIVMIGILPLFTRAIIDNTAGSDYTRVTQYSKSKIEDFAKSALNVGLYTIPGGSTSTTIDEYLDPVSQTWQPVSGPLPVNVEWRRTSTLQQYGFTDLLDNGILDTPLDGAVPWDFRQLQVNVYNMNKTYNPTGAGAFGARRQATVRYLKSF
jgi:type II secretory pathway pseudopilin PulG